MMKLIKLIWKKKWQDGFGCIKYSHTKGWEKTGYQSLKANYNIEQKLSNNGKNFKELHVAIMKLKYWLRAISTHVSKWHI